MAADLHGSSVSGWACRRLPAGLAVPMAVPPDPWRYEGKSTNDGTCAGLTTVKWRRSRVATSAIPIRSATATTEASTAPNGRSAYCRTRSAMRCTSAAVTATRSSSPERSPPGTPPPRWFPVHVPAASTPRSAPARARAAHLGGSPADPGNAHGQHHRHRGPQPAAPCQPRSRSVAELCADYVLGTGRKVAFAGSQRARKRQPTHPTGGVDLGSRRVAVAHRGSNQVLHDSTHRVRLLRSQAVYQLVKICVGRGHPYMVAATGLRTGGTAAAAAAPELTSRWSRGDLNP